MKNRKGFTTIELLLVISLIVVVTTVTVVSYVTVSNRQKEKNYDTMVENIKSSAELYLKANETLDNVLKETGHMSIEIRKLVDDGTLNEYYTVNPKTQESIINLCINVTLGDYNQYIFSEPHYCGSYMTMTPLVVHKFEIENNDIFYRPQIIAVDKAGMEITNEKMIAQDFKDRGIKVKEEKAYEKIKVGTNEIIFTYDNQEYIREVEVQNTPYCIIKRVVTNGEEVIVKIANNGTYKIEDIIRGGYTFTGWKYVDGEKLLDNIVECKNEEPEINEEGDPIGKEIVVEPTWEAQKDTKYIVKYYKETDVGVYSQAEEETYEGTTDSEILLSKINKSYENYKFVYAKNGISKLEIKEDKLYKGTEVMTIEGDRTRIIELYYEREPFIITLEGGTGVSGLTLTGCTKISETKYECEYGKDITITATATSEYNVDNTIYSSEKEIGNKTNGKAFQITKGSYGEITFTGKATPKNYTATIVVENGKAQTNELTIKYETDGSVKITPTSGYGYSGVSCSNGQTASYSNYTLTIKKITGNTTCTVKYVNASKEFGYKESEQTYTASSSGYYIIEGWGAQGGSYGNVAVGGKGGYIKGRVYLTKGEVLKITTGGQNGYNGGGVLTNAMPGGGSTIIKKSSTTLLIAAGGGGSGLTDGTSYVGGAGGSGTSAGGTSPGGNVSAGVGGTNGAGGSSSLTYKYKEDGSKCIEWSYREECDTCGGYYEETSKCKEWNYIEECDTCKKCTGYLVDEWTCIDDTGKETTCTKEVCVAYDYYDCNCEQVKTDCDEYEKNWVAKYDCNCEDVKDECLEYNEVTKYKYGLPGQGGKSSLGSGVTQVTKTDGNNTGNGKAKITYEKE